MNFFNTLNCIYRKSKVEATPDIGLNIALMKWLSYDTDNLPSLSRIAEFLYYTAPDRFFYLIYTLIPFKPKAPFLKRVLKEKDKKTSELYLKVQYVLGWSTRELNIHKPILDKVLKKKYWKERLGVK